MIFSNSDLPHQVKRMFKVMARPTHNELQFTWNTKFQFWQKFMIYWESCWSSAILEVRGFRSWLGPKIWVLFLFHIHYKKNEWLDKKNYERLIHVNKRPFWKAKWAYKLHIFSRVKRVKKYATSKAIWPWKKAVYSQGSTVHSFECTKSFMNFRINVEHVCLLFVRL